MLRNPGQHSGADFLAVVKREDVVSHPWRCRVRCEPDCRLTDHPILTRAASTRRAFFDGHWLMPTGSRRGWQGDVNGSWLGFLIFQALGQHS